MAENIKITQKNPNKRQQKGRKMAIDCGLEELAEAADNNQFALDTAGLKDISGKTGIVYGWHDTRGMRDLRRTLEQALEARDG